MLVLVLLYILHKPYLSDITGPVDVTVDLFKKMK